jgi:riboflavin kinase/FMN adenylyltransferase
MIMLIFDSIHEITDLHKEVGIVLGTFDGLHVGHKRLIEAHVEACKRLGVKSVVFTYSNHPRELTNPELKSLRLIAVEEKIQRIEELGVDYLVLIEFDETLMSTEAEDFVERYLIDGMDVRLISIGFDFKFGRRAAGNAGLLKQLSEKYGYELFILDPVEIEGEKVSSSLIRKHLRHGEIREAERLLGRPYAVSGIIKKGKQLGRQLGYPTANFMISSQMTLIKPGVYVSETEYKGERYHSLTNVGYNPTFNQHELSIETYILNFDKEIYGEMLTVFLVDRLRDEAHFNSIQELVEVIDADVERAKRFYFDHRPL